MVLKQLEHAIRSLGYPQVRKDYEFADFSEAGTRQAALAAFSAMPCSYINACIGVLRLTGGMFPSDSERQQLVMKHHALGAPLILSVATDGQIQPWVVGPQSAVTAGEPFDPADIESVFKKNRDVWGSDGIGRLKSHVSDAPNRQLKLFDTGLVPALSLFFRSKLKEQLEQAFAQTRACYETTHGKLPSLTYLVPYLFRFVTAKIFIDRGDVRGWRELSTPRQILEKAEQHAGSGLLEQLPQEFLDRRVLDQAWRSISSNLHFQNLSVPDLAFIYESSFINKETRRELGIHSTPERLATFIVQNLNWSLVPVNKRLVFEPFAGHSIFLACALARMAEDLDPMSAKDRHEYFKQRLIAVEKDPLAREVARVVLTLADYPNEDGWQLNKGDVFDWPQWDKTIRNATVVLANPPYESFDPSQKASYGAKKATIPAEFLDRLMKSPPTLLGLVLPQSFLSSPIYQAANRSLAERYSEIEIVELPKVFEHADNETIAIMAHGLRESGTTVKVRYSEIPAKKIDEFLHDFRRFNQRTATLRLAPTDTFTLWLPPNNSLFDFLDDEIQLGAVASIAKGIHWKPRSDGKSKTAPRTDVASNRQKADYRLGCEKMSGNLTQFHVEHLRYLSLRNSDHYERDRAFLLPWEKRKVVVNAARFERKAPWRIAAFADHKGLAFTKQFFAIWPNAGVSEFALGAILSSPIANLFSLTNDLERHNHISTLQRLPLPSLGHLKPGAILDRLSKALQKLIRDEKQNALINGAKIKEAVIRLDAAVLDAYALTAHQQRQLLDKFDGWKRPLCIDFDRYFPKHFKDMITLSDFVAINYDWTKTNERRCELIDKECSDIELSIDERLELDHLQHLADLLIRLKAPYDTDRADKLIAKLKASGKWTD